jgi:fido (protein-threonine AMPylation protein)
MAKLYFVSDGKEPLQTWGECKKAQEEWVKWLKENKVEDERLRNAVKDLAVNFIFTSNKLENTLPQGTDETKMKRLLSETYDSDSSRIESDSDSTGGDMSAGGRQLSQHLSAFKLLCQKRGDKMALPDLTEILIQQVHSIMMRGLKTERGEPVNAGCYRKISVHAGQHLYPSHECIPANMEKIVKEYNRKSSEPHDMYQLSSWLHYNVVSLHPFEDGNGRISRLLWCYSLMRDGLPFPAVLTSGHKRSQSHLVQCLQRDRKYVIANHPHLTTLTVVSVYQAWKTWNESLVQTALPVLTCKN